MKTGKCFRMNILLSLVAAILCFGPLFTCCLGYGYGLGDIAYLFLLWGICSIYLIIMIFSRKKFFENPKPPIILGIILLIFIINLFFFRGPECPCGF